MQRKPQCITLTDVCAPGRGAVEGQPAEVGAHRAVDQMCRVVKSVRDGVHCCSVDECVSLCHNGFDAA
jgi:hypothetical protein